jgi:hypothetical protein
LFPLGLRLISRVLADLSTGRKVAVPQDETLATWEPSWDRPPIFRPELPELGVGPSNIQTTVAADEAADVLSGMSGLRQDYSVPFTAQQYGNGNGSGERIGGIQ